ncbi:MAG: TIGR04283 family arsenosugar biosynthesis glycosyltransferase [Leeuwenhoekiella sp.]
MISIVIPMLNEAENLPKLIAHLATHASDTSNLSEVIFVDGGSIDGTQNIALRLAKNYPTLNISLLPAEKGRARQMNTGAKKSTGSILYFLHADSFPPQDYDKLIIDEVEKGNPAGCFRMKFISNHWWLKLAGWLTRFNWRACRGGDQSQFITSSLFNDIGGYDETYIIYEDNILLNELYARKQFVVIPHWIQSSARLYETKGVWYVQYHFWKIYIKKWKGAGPDELFEYYVKYFKRCGDVPQQLNNSAEIVTDN